MIHKGRCDDGFIWNPSTCKCKCDKSCNVGEYLDYVNCKCKKRLIDKLLEKIDEYTDGSKMVYNATLSDYGRVCKSCTLYVVLLIIAFIIIMDISGAYFYFYSTQKKTMLVHCLINLVR